jgi:hypothetical protein
MDKYTVRDSSGSIDVTASTNAYAKALTAWAAENEIPAERIAAAVNTVLDRHPGQNYPMPALLSDASQLLGATPQTFKVLSDRVHAYVTGQAKAQTLFVIKGKGGGVTKVAPQKKSA